MGFFGNTHKLPRFPEALIPTFRRLCEPLPVDMIAELQRDFEGAVRETASRAQANPRIDKRRLEQVAERCRLMMQRYEEFSTEQRALIIGAVRYFALVDDVLADDTFASGLDDDAKVVNYVLEELGVEDCFIEVG